LLFFCLDKFFELIFFLFYPSALKWLRIKFFYWEIPHVIILED
jgi:hypothetical protein